MGYGPPLQLGNSGPLGPQATDAFFVTPSNTLPISSDPNNKNKYNFVNLYVDVAGTVAVVTADGTTITFAQTFPAGSVIGGGLDLVVQQVLVTGTTATLVALAGRYMIQR